MNKLLIVLAIVFPLSSEADYPQYKEGYQSGWIGAYLSEGKARPGRPSTPGMPARKGGDKRPDVERGYADGFADASEKMKKL